MNRGPHFYGDDCDPPHVPPPETVQAQMPAPWHVFLCAMCGQQIATPATEEEIEDEFLTRANVDDLAEETTDVCDDCYEKFQAWANGRPAE